MIRSVAHHLEPGGCIGYARRLGNASSGWGASWRWVCMIGKVFRYPTYFIHALRLLEQAHSGMDDILLHLRSRKM